MNLSSSNLKLIIAAFYLTILFVGLYFLFSTINIKDLTSYEFIRSNQDIILQYKKENFVFLTTVFFIFSVIWILLLGFAGPILIFAGFVFGKWWGILISLFAASIGATLLYLLAKLFFSEFIKEKLNKKFSKLNEFFKKNELIYFTIFRFIGGGGIPYGIQNVLPVLFNISTKNYFLGTLLGSGPPMFISVALGAGIGSYIDQNTELSILAIITSRDIYLPIIGFLIILILAFILKKIFFKKSLK
jgi:uncharacterized membrane protein YdjX (TVP38/TMEM64 family)|tara:strand:- start:367 stop:1101 length:735 start_codon:yes stop_codon:yes gene_type:complete